MPYVRPELIADEAAQAEGSLAALTDLIPGWVPQEGSIETQIAEGVGIAAATIAQFIIDQAAEAYAGFGQRSLTIGRVSANPASAPATITVKDTTGYPIPAGFTAIWESPSTGQPVAFATIADANVGTGDTAVSGVTMVAVEAGIESNEVSGAGRDFDTLNFVTDVTLEEPAAGGEEEETDDAYLDRVADHARRLKAVPITVADHAAFSLDVPGVDRAAAINLLDPSADPEPPSIVHPLTDLDELGHVTVFPLDVEGNPVDEITKAAVLAYLTGEERPLGVTVHVEDAEITTLAVVAEIRLTRDGDPDVTPGEVEDAIAAYFDRANWGRDDQAAGLWQLPREEVDRSVRSYDVAHVAAQTFGVAHVVSLTINGFSEVELSGWAPLPDLTSVDVSVYTP
jgi:hypothetical protein